MHGLRQCLTVTRHGKNDRAQPHAGECPRTRGMYACTYGPLSSRHTCGMYCCKGHGPELQASSPLGSRTWSAVLSVSASLLLFTYSPFTQKKPRRVTSGCGHARRTAETSTATTCGPLCAMQIPLISLGCSRVLASTSHLRTTRNRSTSRCRYDVDGNPLPIP